MNVPEPQAGAMLTTARPHDNYLSGDSVGGSEKRHYDPNFESGLLDLAVIFAIQKNDYKTRMYESQIAVINN
jgi:hypothetical protein